MIDAVQESMDDLPQYLHFKDYIYYFKRIYIETDKDIEDHEVLLKELAKARAEERKERDK